MGSLGDSRGDRIGHRRRVKLATLSVEKVLPLWNSLLPSDNTPVRALELADKVMTGNMSRDVVDKEAGSLWSHVDDILWRHEDMQSIAMVGYGAIQVIRGAMSDDHFLLESCEGASDSELEPYDYDSSFLAAIAYSGGATWEAGSNSQKRFEYWTWWLTSAVDAAMSVA
jgi:hypothetical protein